MLPPLSVPSAPANIPVATPMADPELEPPGQTDSFHGLRGTGKRVVRVGQTKSEFMGGRLAHDNCARVTETTNDDRISWSLWVEPRDSALRSRRRLACRDQILYSDRDAVEGTTIDSRVHLVIGHTSCLRRFIREGRDVHAETLIETIAPGDRPPNELDAAYLAGPQRLADSLIVMMSAIRSVSL